MNINDSSKKLIKEVIETFASEEIQNRAWLKKDPKILLDPEDFFEWFGDIGITKNAKPDYLTQEEWELINNFLNDQEKFINDYGDYVFNNIGRHLERMLTFDPWIDFRGKAQKVLFELEKLGW